MPTAVVLPGKSHAIASEFAGVMADAQIDVPMIALEIVDAVRVDDAAGVAGKVVVQGFDGFLRVGVSFAKKIADQFLFLGVDAENRVAGLFIKSTQTCDVAELAVTVRMKERFFRALRRPRRCL